MDAQLRELERRASEEPSARSLLDLARALDRVGREGEAALAAVRSIELGDSPEARALLRAPRHGDRVVPWAGPRRLGEPRVVARPYPASGSFQKSSRDVGRGLVIVRRPDVLLALDVVLGRVAWSVTASITDFELVHALVLAQATETSHQTFTFFDPTTGDVRARARIETAASLSASPLADGRVAFVELQHPRAESRILSAPLASLDAVETVFLVPELVGAAESSHDGNALLLLCAHPESARIRLAAYSPRGDLYWRKENEKLLALDRERVLVELGPHRELFARDVRSGRVVAEATPVTPSGWRRLAGITREHVLVDETAPPEFRLRALDRETLAVKWERARENTPPTPGRYAASADTVAFLDGRPEQGRTLRLLDAATGVELDARSVGRASGLVACAGRFVLLDDGDGNALVFGGAAVRRRGVGPDGTDALRREGVPL